MRSLTGQYIRPLKGGCGARVATKLRAKARPRVRLNDAPDPLQKRVVVVEKPGHVEFARGL